MEGARTLRLPPSHGRLSIEDFQFCGILGEGQFGRVMMARNIESQEIVAVKVLRKGFLVQKGSRTISHAISEKQVRAYAASRPSAARLRRTPVPFGLVLAGAAGDGGKPPPLHRELAALVPGRPAPLPGDGFRWRRRPLLSH
eukprot:scaffold229977_cov30-Tisochrysis_lutea.AAC.1